MIKTVKGIDKLKELEEKYGSIDNLKGIIESSQGNMLHDLDLENWEYFLNHHEESLQEGKVMFLEKMV